MLVFVLYANEFSNAVSGLVFVVDWQELIRNSVLSKKVTNKFFMQMIVSVLLSKRGQMNYAHAFCLKND